MTQKVPIKKPAAPVNTTTAPVVEESPVNVPAKDITTAIPYRVKLSPPWNAYWSKLNGIFEYDKQITVTPIEKAENGYLIVIKVDDQAKYVALNYILPKEVKYGNVNVEIRLLPANNILTAPVIEPSTEELLGYFETALKDTGRYVGKQIVTTPTGEKIGYVITKCGVYQFFNDDLTTLYGWTTVTIEQLFKDVFIPGGYSASSIIYYSSEIVQ